MYAHIVRVLPKDTMTDYEGTGLGPSTLRSFDNVLYHLRIKKGYLDG